MDTIEKMPPRGIVFELANALRDASAQTTPLVGLFPLMGLALLWTFVHYVVGDRMITWMMPRGVIQKAMANTKNINEFKVLSKANCTAYIHAIVTTPFCLYTGVTLWVFGDPWNGYSDVFYLVAMLMCGYFLWDILECVINYKTHGLAFLLHAILSLVGLYVQLVSKLCPLFGFISLSCASEISTPLLHLRWFLIKGKTTDTKYFKIVNALCIFLFVSYRLILLPFIVFPKFWMEVLNEHSVHLKDMSFAREILLVVITIAWAALNLVWGTKFIISQIKVLFDPRKKTNHDGSSHGSVSRKNNKKE